MRYIKNSWQRMMGETWTCKYVSVCVCAYITLNTDDPGLATIAISLSIKTRESERATEKV